MVVGLGINYHVCVELIVIAEAQALRVEDWCIVTLSKAWAGRKTEKQTQGQS